MQPAVATAHYWLVTRGRVFHFERVNCPPLLRPWLLLACLLVTPAGAAERHRATRLGQPETRFAPPLHHPQDLRNRFAEPLLRPDFIEILRQWGWEGDPDDLFRAAATAEITEVQIPVGGVMPFMSARQNRRPVALRNVEWAGREPIPAYAFTFTSNGRRWRCVTPRPCTNFFLEDLGPEPRHALVLDCRVPEQAPVGHPVEVCFTVRNAGNQPESGLEVTLALPPGVTVANLAAAAVLADGRIRWPLDTLPPDAVAEVCAVLLTSEPGRLTLAAEAFGAKAPRAESACLSLILGVPAILVELVDAADPVEVGGEVVYLIDITNQGSAPLHGLRVSAAVPATQEFLGGAGAAELTVSDGVLTTAPLPVLAPQAVASWRVVMRAAAAGDTRLRIEAKVEDFPRGAIEEVEVEEQF
ncbi:MAG TPA: hypothetical protein PKE47_09100 [Verrucomicrobiota bacterium]|nr:hypothetical protein [Verrucomicrobiota bacterium]